MNRRQCVQGLSNAAALGLLSSAPLASAALNLPATVPPEAQVLGPNVRLQGQMRFRYWGFHVYDAQLWVRPGFEPTRFVQHPFVLSLTYARALRAQDIAERSLEEIERQRAINDEEAPRWLGQLQQVLADVKDGDRLSGHFMPPQQSTFFFNGQITGQLNDAALVPLFFGIWLAPQTSQPKLRRALLGLNDADGKRRGT